MEASRQRLLNGNVSEYRSSIKSKDTARKDRNTKEDDTQFENSMIFGKGNVDSNADDSFLALERQCNMEDKLVSDDANDTLLFDIEPPSELWNQTVNQSSSISQLNRTQDEYNEDGTIEISPVKYIGLIRPSTIIEETSSQFESSSKTASSLATKSSLYETASTNEAEELLIESVASERVDNAEPLLPEENTHKLSDRQRRGTFAFKRADYTFFPAESLDAINENTSYSKDASINTPLKNNKIPSKEEIDNDSKSEDDEDQFNNTLERVEYLLEKGKQILEETPIAKRSIHQSFLETPHFSCKRKRLLNDMASIEMFPLSKRAPRTPFLSPRKL